MLKNIKILLLCILVCFTLCSCSEPEEKYDISGFIDSFGKMDYAAMYSYCQPVVDIKQDAFVKKYSDIFKGLGVTEVDISDLNGPDEEGVYTFIAVYKTEDYGDITNSFTLKAGLKNKQTVVFWDYSLIFPEMEEGSTVQVKTLDADRGEIFSSDGVVLAKNSYADTVYLDVPNVKDISAVAKIICPMTGITNGELVEKFNKALKNNVNAVSLGEYLPGALTEDQRTSILAVPGLGIDNKMYTKIRSYPLAEAAAHIIGYTGLVDKDAVPEGYTSSDRIGKTGLEVSYESTLRGADGKIVYIKDKWGKNIRTLYKVEAQQGKDLRLTIDSGLQQRAYNALKSRLTGKETGAVIVMDAKTGNVQAMVSYPSYDDNVFNLPVPKATMDMFNAEDSNKPLYPRATQWGYPPGSAIKPFTAAAALESGAINTNSVFTGKIVNNKWMPEEEGWTWKPIKRVDPSGTPLKMENALIHSDNIYFAWVALKMGDQTLTDYFTKYGLTESVPFDLKVAQANLINADTAMYRRLLAEMGYGQGEILVTPIQLAAMYTAFANGSGDMIQPILVQKICQTEGFEYKTVSEEEKKVWKENVISKNSINTLLPYMEEVVTKGTAKRARIPGIRIAGKTGTAQIGAGDKKREISWFAGFWVDGSYDRLVIVTLDVAENQGSKKLDIAKELLSP